MESLNKSQSKSVLKSVQKISTLDDVNFDNKNSIIETRDANGKIMATQIYVDLFVFKTFALLMCPGRFHNKAQILFNMAAGLIDTVEDMEISYCHPRMKRVFKLLIWFSEIFPKKYQSEFYDDI